MKALQARGISVRFRDQQVLDTVSVELESGSTSMLVGPNGAGKSTLLKVLLGLVRPDSGFLEVDGERTSINNDWKQRIGYLPEAVAFSENLTGQQVMRFFARARGVRKKRVDTVLERVGLAAAGRRTVRGYSRGMRQRLGLGISILSKPDLLILDEPTAGLDQEGLGVLWSIIEEWQASGRMTFASTHDLVLMERHVNTICVLREGRILAQGSAEDLRDAATLPHRIWLSTHPQAGPKVDLLCNAMRKWGRGRIEAMKGRVLVEVPSDAILEIVDIQGGFPGVVSGIRVEEPTLDRVYDRLLGAD
jgi:Cu-processing system ATP-binding protein